jgi:hypothetical protein
MQQPIQWALGQLYPSWTIRAVQDNGQPLNLTGVTTGELSFLVYNANYAEIATGSGAFSVINAADGIVTYTFASGDVPTTPGTYYVRIKIIFNNTSPFFTDYVKWVIAP